jgi:hypothetical protein
MGKRVLAVADRQVMPAVNRYVRYFIDGERNAWPRAEMSRAMAEEYRCFRLQPPPDDTLGRFDLKNYTAVYYWGLYDHILLQDTFRRHVEAGEDLDSSPLCVAHYLLYARGQFAAARPRIVQPIILDPRLLAATALAEKRLDRAQADAWLKGPLRQDRERLRQALDRAGFWGDFLAPDTAEQAEPRNLRLELPPHTFTEISEVVRETIEQKNLRLLWIDDNRDWLKIPYEALGGVDYPDGPNKEPNSFWVLRSPAEDKLAALERVASFEKLCRVVSEFSGSRKPCLSVVVTDVLFGRGAKVSGLDILRHVRGGDLAASPRNVVMAFTGYGSPLLTAACHGEGADFVVQKSGVNHHGYTRNVHESERSSEPVVEIFWNMLWLRAATWFTSECLAHLEHELLDSPSASAMKPEEAKRVVDRVHHDIDVVFPPHEWLKCFKRSRQQVFEALIESAEYVYYWFDARGHETRELKRWRSRLSDQLKNLGGRFRA